LALAGGTSLEEPSRATLLKPKGETKISI
jgi:hypothetical protein